jgi:hypothetical protein
VYCEVGKLIGNKLVGMIDDCFFQKVQNLRALESAADRHIITPFTSNTKLLSVLLMEYQIFKNSTHLVTCPASL